MKRPHLSSAELISIPDELIRDILLSLPVKSLVRFTCVCKSWKLIISDPQFVKLHLHRSTSNAAHFSYARLLFDSDSDYLLLSSQNQKRHNLYPIGDEYNERMIGACNGLVSLIKWDNPNHAEARFCLWNPATRLRSQFSPPLRMLEHKWKALESTFYDRIFGFGYDCLNDTFKVVVVEYHDRIKEHGETVVNVYDMGSSCWRSIQPFHVPSRGVWLSGRGVYVRGTLNWILRIINPDSYIIVSLDLGSEVYSQLAVPAQHQIPTLGVLKDCLCVLQYDGNTRFLIWSMKKFGVHASWTQLFDMDLNKDIFRRTISNQYLKAFVLSEDDEDVLLTFQPHTDYSQVLYNKREDTCVLDREPKYSFIVGWNVENYVESLVSPY